MGENRYTENSNKILYDNFDKKISVRVSPNRYFIIFLISYLTQNSSSPKPTVPFAISSIPL